MAVITAMVLLQAGCGRSVKEIDAAALAQSLTNEVSFDDEMENVDDDTISMYIDVPENIESVMYMGSGETAEEVAVFTAEDENAAGEMLENVKSHLDDQIASFKAYKAEEVKRVEEAVLEQKGKYVILCVSADSSKAKELIEEAFK